MDFRVDERFFGLFPDLAVAYLVVEGNISKPKKDTTSLLEEAKSSIMERDIKKPQKLPEIAAWREGFRKVGISPSKFYSSVEALVRRCIKGNIPGPIHPFVDLYNAFSIMNLVPVGGHDMDRVEGDIEVTFTNGGEEFITFGGEVETLDEGEPVYKDRKGILTRRWVWRQTSRDLIKEETKRVFVPIDVLYKPLNPEGLAEELKSLILDFFDEVNIPTWGVLRKGNSTGTLTH